MLSVRPHEFTRGGLGLAQNNMGGSRPQHPAFEKQSGECILHKMYIFYLYNISWAGTRGCQSNFGGDMCTDMPLVALDKSVSEVNSNISKRIS